MFESLQIFWENFGKNLQSIFFTKGYKNLREI